MARQGALIGMSPEAIDALLDGPPVVTLAAANSALGLGRTLGYSLAKSGRYPCPVLRVGHSYRVATAELLDLVKVTYPRQETCCHSSCPHAHRPHL